LLAAAEFQVGCFQVGGTLVDAVFQFGIQLADLVFSPLAFGDIYSYTTMPTMAFPTTTGAARFW
jgi:hypothetical protein